mgnify:CR=1 FL=1
MAVVSAGFVEMIVTMVKSPRDNAKSKVEHLYTGPQDTELAESMIECDQEVRLLTVPLTVRLAVRTLTRL